MKGKDSSVRKKTQILTTSCKPLISFSENKPQAILNSHFSIEKRELTEKNQKSINTLKLN